MVADLLLDLSILATESRFRGIGRYAAMLARGLADQLADGGTERLLGVERLCWFGPGEVDTDIDGLLGRLSAEQAPVMAHAEWAYRVRFGMAATSRAVRAAVVHSPHPEATPLGPLGCPRVVTCHDLISLRFPQLYAQSWKEGYTWGRRRLDHRRYHRADHIMAISEATASDLVSLLSVPADKITVVYPGLELSKWSPEPAPGDADVVRGFGLREHGYVLYVGAGDWRKNAAGMLRGLAIAKRSAPARELALVWVGMLDEAETAQVRQLAADLGLSDSLRLLGYVPDEQLGPLYRRAVAKLFVSRYEGFGYPVAEAMAVGCPVITANRSSTVEIAADAAVVVDPERHEAIAEAIVELARSARERQRWRARGLKRVQLFSTTRMATQALSLFRKVGRYG